jgi:hypothetical protein
VGQETEERACVASPSLVSQAAAKSLAAHVSAPGSCLASWGAAASLPLNLPGRPHYRFIAVTERFVWLRMESVLSVWLRLGRSEAGTWVACGQGRSGITGARCKRCCAQVHEGASCTSLLSQKLLRRHRQR